MPRQKPEVIAGMREPRSTRLEAMQEVEARDPEQVQVQPVADEKKLGKLYLSKFPSYRVTITSPGDVTHPVTGQKTIQKGITALFQNGQYRNNAKDKATRKLIDDTLQRNSRFGKPGKDNPDFWLASDQEKAIAERRLAEAKTTFASLSKEVKAEVLAEFEQGSKADHSLPAA